MTGLSISEVFADRRDRGQAALVPYLTAGFPEAGSTVDALTALADAGGDILELGIPFSDPLADGPTIQRSSFRSLGNGTNAASVLRDLATFRSASDCPVVLFTYLNPVLRYGVDAFLSDAVEAGAQGLLLTDLPTGADPELEAKVKACGLDLIRLAAPTTSVERIGQIAEQGSGFLYYISRTGVTGARHRLRAELGDEVRRLKSAVSIPVAVGFGISTPEQAASVASVADGVVVGSALIQALDRDGIDGARAFVASLREGMDGAARTG